MRVLSSYVCGRWVEGQGALETLVNPATEEPLAQAGSGGIDRKAALQFARNQGGPALRAMGFAEQKTQHALSHGRARRQDSTGAC